MSHDELLREIRGLGCHLSGQSAKHEIYVNPSTRQKASIPRQKEISDAIALLIKKHLESDHEL